MKTKILLFVSLVLLAVQGWAAPVDLSKAQATAQSFTISDASFTTQLGHTDLKLAYAEQSSRIKNQPVFYVFNTTNGFVIVSGDDRTDDILAYGEGEFDINKIPDGMRCLLDEYKEQIEFLQSHPKLIVDRISQDATHLLGSSGSYTIGTTLLTSQWDQQAPYNNQCIFKSKLTNKLVTCVTGCCPTAIAQIMYYWKYPSSSPNLSSYTTSTLKLYVPYLSSKSFQWYNMVDDKSNATTTSSNAVSYLMRSVGQAVQADYGPDETPGKLNNDVRNVLINTFGYSSSAKSVVRSKYLSTLWNKMIKNEINARRPVYYYAVNHNNNKAHAFIIDGYDSNSCYHINWGWGPGYNYCWFKLGAFNYRGKEYNDKHAMIIDLRPKTVVTTTPSSLTFSNKSIGTYNATFRVNGYYLTGDLNLTLNGATVFKIDKTTITKTAAESGAVVTVFYKPTAIGTQTTTITISGGGLTESKTVTLKGTCIKRTATTSATVSNSDNDIDDLAFNSKVYSDGQRIIIESPFEQSAVISDISGHAQNINLKNGRNEIPVNANGIYIVRIREKTTKLMLK